MRKIIFITGMLIGLAVFAQEIDYSIAANYQYKYLRNSLQLKDTSLKVAWREEVYDSRLKQKVNLIVLNESYFTNISEPEKAVLGYLATFVGNECQWDGTPNSEQNNIKCKILTALSMGYQCSDANKEFFKKWFSESSDVMKEIESCKSTIFSASEQTSFKNISITTKDDVIKIKYTAIKANISKQKMEDWTEELTFGLNNDKLDLLKRTKKK
ncbi:MAG TPA: hypothetical protein VJ455_10800 [Ignavibacteria bacterium]|nr:hypothetical protein [Ignavibacteria bacterium]